MGLSGGEVHGCFSAATGWNDVVVSRETRGAVREERADVGRRSMERESPAGGSLPRLT